MELLTEELKRRLPPLRSTEEIPLEERIAICKWFTPDSSWTWYILEGEEEQDGDWLFFGLVEGWEREFGYFSLNEISGVRGPLGLPVERDLHFQDRPLREILDRKA